VLKFGQFVKYSRNTWKVFSFGVGEGWRRSVGPIVCEIKQYCAESRRRGIFCILLKEGRVSGLVTPCVITGFLNPLLKEG
jgi:hypothetical protein